MRYVHPALASLPGACRRFGPYVLLELLLPGGTLMALLLFLVQRLRETGGPGLALVDRLLAHGLLDDYHLAHAARAELARRLGRVAEARASFERAMALARQAPERRFLARRLAALPP